MAVYYREERRDDRQGHRGDDRGIHRDSRRDVYDTPARTPKDHWRERSYRDCRDRTRDARERDHREQEYKNERAGHSDRRDHRYRRSRSPRPQEYARSAFSRHRRSRSPIRRAPNDFDDDGRSAPCEATPAVSLEDRERHLQNWDVPPPGFERIRADIAKATGIFPPPGNITKMANYVPPPLDPARAALLATLSLDGSAAAGTGAGSATAPLALTLSHHHHPGRGQEGSRLDDSRAGKRLRIAHPALKDIGLLGGKPALVKFFGDFVNRVCKPHYDPSALVDAVSAVIVAPSDSAIVVVDFFSPEDAQLLLDNRSRLGAHLAAQYPALAADSSVDFCSERFSGASPSIADDADAALLADALPHAQLVLYGVPPALSPQHARELLAPFGPFASFTFLTKRRSHDGDNDSADHPSHGLGVVLFDMDEDIINDVVLQAFASGDIAIGQHVLQVCRLAELVDVDEAVGEEKRHIRRLLSAFELLPMVVSSTASPVLQFFNLLGDEPIDDRTALEQRIAETLSAFGSVNGVVIPTPADDLQVFSEWGVIPGQGRVFVQFSSATEAVQALKATAGSVCGGRTVFVAFCSPERFERRDF